MDEAGRPDFHTSHQRYGGFGTPSRSKVVDVYLAGDGMVSCLPATVQSSLGFAPTNAIRALAYTVRGTKKNGAYHESETMI